MSPFQGVIVSLGAAFSIGRRQIYVNSRRTHVPPDNVTDWSPSIDGLRALAGFWLFGSFPTIKVNEQSEEWDERQGKEDRPAAFMNP